MSIHLRLLGTFRITVGESHNARRLTSRHSRRLLAYIALHEGPPLQRANVAGILFPEMPDVRARRMLSQALWRLRNDLGMDAVVGDYKTLSLAPNVWVDVRVFRSLAQSQQVQDWEQALDLYGGEFWPECYDDWALLAREQLRETYWTLLQRLVDHYKREGEYERALHYARQMVRLEPLREHAHREVIQIYLILDRPGEALQQYETLRALLEEELGVEPSSESQALYRAARARGQVGQGAAAAPLFSGEGYIPFVGRHAEREHLLSAMERAQRGYGGFVLVEGTPGMGKSRLLREVAESARWRGMLAGYGQALPRGGAPYAPLAEAVAHLLSPLCVTTLRRTLPETDISAAATIWPALGTPATDARPQQVRQAIPRVILSLARCAPIVLLLDDLQNADADVIAILEALCPHIDTTPLLMVLAFRPLEMRSQPALWERLLALERKIAPQTVTLGPLSEEEVGLLVGAALGMPPEAPLVHHLASSMAGVPLHVVETLRYLHRRGILRRSGTGAWELVREDWPLPPSVPALVQARLSRLPRALRSTLEFLAVMGERQPLSIVARAIGDGAPAVVNDLIRYGFLTVEGEACSFVHALVQEAIYDAILPERRRRLHRDAADLLRQVPPPDWEQIAFHLDQAGAAEQAVVAHYRAAQQALKVFAYSRVFRHCDAALRLADGLDATVCDLWLLRGEAHMLSGDGPAAATDVARAIRLARCLHDERRLAQACLLAGKICIRNSRYRLAERFLRRAYDAFAHIGHTYGMVEASVFLSDVAETTGSLLEARTYVRQALRLVEAEDLSRQRLKVVARAGLIAARLGQMEEAERYYHEGVRLAEEAGDAHVRGACLNGLGLLYLEQRRHAQAESTFQRVLDIADQINDRHNASVTQLNLAVAAGNAGRFATAHRRGVKALEMAREAYNARTTILTLLLLAATEAAWADFERALAHLHEADLLAHQKGYLAAQGFVLRTRGILAREQNHLREAIRYGEAAIDFFRTHMMYEKIPTAAYALGSTLLVAGHFARAEEVLQQGLEMTTTRMLRAFLTAGLAWARRHTRGAAAARELVDACLPTLEQIQMDEHLPRAWYHLYRALGDDDREGAAHALHRAYLALQAQCLEVPEERHHAFLHYVLSHRLITQAWLSTRTRPVERLRLRLPHREGKGHVVVLWTVDAGDEDALVEARHGPTELRRYRLRRLMREAEAQGARATHRALADALGVSVATVRRDLRAMQEESTAG